MPEGGWGNAAADQRGTNVEAIDFADGQRVAVVTLAFAY